MKHFNTEELEPDVVFGLDALFTTRGERNEKSFVFDWISSLIQNIPKTVLTNDILRYFQKERDLKIYYM